MTALLKQRLVGAIVLISLGMIFIPMLLTGKAELTDSDLPTNIPPKPLYEIQAPAVLPLDQKSSEEVTAETVPNTAIAKAVNEESQRPADPVKVEEKEVKPEVSEKDAAVVAKVETKTEKQVVPSTESAKPVPEQPAPIKPTESKAEIPAASEGKIASASSKPPIVSGWVVQLGSFSKEKNAIRLRDSLRKNGYASFVEAYEQAGKTSYRVRVGPELTRELAEDLKQRLKQETKLDGLVMSYPG